MLKSLRDWYEAHVIPALDWIQVEVTTHCESRCTYCPHTVFKKIWTSAHMSIFTFDRLIPSFKSANLVHLQGWGEPLLHPSLFEMIGRAKKAGARVGFTTNGMHLDCETIRRTISSGVDLVAISLAGTPPVNDSIRFGNKGHKILESIAALTYERQKSGPNRSPAVHVAYTLTKSTADDLPTLLEMVADKSVDRIVVNTVDFNADPGLSDEVVLPRNLYEYEYWRKKLDDIKASAERRGIAFTYYLKHPIRRRFCCTENAERSLFVAVDGSVSPCVFTCLPVRNADKENSNESQAAERENIVVPSEYRRIVFGNINTTPLPTIWRTSAYRRFRHSFAKGALDPPCDLCPKMFMTEDGKKDTHKSADNRVRKPRTPK